MPTPSCLLKIEPGAAKAATNRRQPPGWSFAACSGLSWKSRGPDGGWEGSGRAGDREDVIVERAHSAQESTRDWAMAWSRSVRTRSPAGERGHEHLVVAARAGLVDVGHARSDGPPSRHGSDQPRNRSIRSASRSRRASRPRWIRDFTVPSETPVMSAISGSRSPRRRTARSPSAGRRVIVARAALRTLVALGRQGGRHRVGVLAGRRLPALVLELRVGLDRAALAGTLVSIAALTAIRFSHDLTLPPRKPARLRKAREERLLDRVGRLVAVRDHPHDEREELVLVERDEVVECVEVAVAGALEQDEVTALDGVVDDRRRAKVLHGQGAPPDGEFEARRV